MSKKKDILTIEIDKNKTDVFMRLEAAPELEEFFRVLAIGEYGLDEKEYTQVSNKWFDDKGNGIKFYKNNTKFQEVIKKSISGKITGGTGQKLYSINVTNEFGKGLFDEAYSFNIAPLRAVGISKGIKLKTTDLIPYEDMNLYCEYMKYFLKSFEINFMSKQKISVKFQLSV